MAVSIPELVRELNTLPAERIAEVYDFVLFLKTRTGAVVDASGEWTEQDKQDAVAAGMRYAEATLPD